MGEIYSCYNTLHLESQQSGTLLSIISGPGREGDPIAAATTPTTLPLPFYLPCLCLWRGRAKLGRRLRLGGLPGLLA
jgi:hypothetical protein